MCYNTAHAVPITQGNFNFILNNVKGLKPAKKQIKLLERFKSKLAPSGVLFTQKTHSANEIERNRKDEMIWQKIFLSHGKSNSCGAFIAFLDSKSVTITKETDNSGRILVLQVKIDDEI